MAARRLAIFIFSRPEPHTKPQKILGIPDQIILLGLNPAASGDIKIIHIPMIDREDIFQLVRKLFANYIIIRKSLLSL